MGNEENQRRNAAFRESVSASAAVGAVATEIGNGGARAGSGGRPIESFKETVSMRRGYRKCQTLTSFSSRD